MCPEMKARHQPGRPISAMAVDIYALGATIKAVKDPKMNNRGVWERNFFRLLSAMMDISPQKRPTAKQVSHALTTLHETERSRLEFQLPSTKRARRLLFAAVASHIDVTADRHSCRDATSDHHTTTITTVTTSGRHTTAGRLPQLPNFRCQVPNVPGDY